MPFRDPQPLAALNSIPIVRGAGIALVALALTAVAAFASGGGGPAEEARSAGPTDNGDAVLSAEAGADAAPVARPRVAIAPSAPAIEATVEASAVAHTQTMIVSHEANSDVFQQRVQFRGVAEPGSVVSSGDAVAEIGPYGNWSLELEMKPGANLKTFDVVEPDGDSKRESIIVTYHPPAVSKVKDSSVGTKSDKHKSSDPNKTSDWVKDKNHTDTGSTKPVSDGAVATEFRASQKYGSCGEDPPYDVFFGTAAPGALISVSSPYGSATTVADEQGNWKVKVQFPTAPAGTSFEVEVTDGSSVKTFSFVHKL